MQNGFVELCLKSRRQYLFVLKRLSELADRAELVVSCDEMPDAFAETLTPVVLERKMVTAWTGTVSAGAPGVMFVLHAGPFLWQTFRNLDSFAELENRDVAFYDRDGRLLLWTVGHECLAYIKRGLAI